MQCAKESEILCTGNSFYPLILSALAGRLNYPTLPLNLRCRGGEIGLFKAKILTFPIAIAIWVVLLGSSPPRLLPSMPFAIVTIVNYLF